MFRATQFDLESSAEKLFQPFMTKKEYKDKHSTNKYMVFNLSIVFIYNGGGMEEVIIGSSPNDLLKKLRAIERYIPTEQWSKPKMRKTWYPEKKQEPNTETTEGSPRTTAVQQT